MNISIQDEIKLKFRMGPVCPHCGSRSINKFGFYRGIQRYRCKECKKTFNLYTKTILSYSHFKDKWDSFIHTMKNEISLREAEKEVGVSYVTLFYWRHKILTVLNEENDYNLHGILELSQIKLKFIDKYRNKREDEVYTEGGAQDIFFSFLYQRNDRLEAYIYKDKTKARSFIYDLSENIAKRSTVCLGSNYPFRYPLLYKKIKVAEKSAKKYKKPEYYNTDKVKKYLGSFKCWLRMFRGVSSKNLIKYAAFFKAYKIFNNMEGLILSSLRNYESLTNQYSAKGTLIV